MNDYKTILVTGSAGFVGYHISKYLMSKNFKVVGIDGMTNNYDVGLATVYRVLTQFENARIVVKHQFESNKSVYELNDPLNHDHMVCVDTGETTEFYDEDIKNKQREIAAKHGYELLDQSIVLYVKKVKK